jgi:hypothetical protein
VLHPNLVDAVPVHAHHLDAQRGRLEVVGGDRNAPPPAAARPCSTPTAAPACRAIRFGPRSPITTEKYVMPTTTIDSAEMNACGAMSGKPDSHAARGSADTVSPMAPLGMPIDVMPT